MPARLLVIGLDAAEPTLLEKWAADGSLPGMAALIGRGVSVRLSNSLETLPGAIWPEIMSGRSAGKLPLYYHPLQLRSGEAIPRPLREDEIDPTANFWSLASSAGKRVAVIDIPQSALNRDLNGVQVMEWGLHDRTFQIRSHPPELLDELRVRHGDHPVIACDHYGQRSKDYAHLLADLVDGVERKTRLLLDVLNREAWDLFTCGIGETHCIGHQFWRHFDPAHPAHDPAASEAFKSAIPTIYRKVDAAIARLVGAAGTDSRVLVFASHGMGAYVGGYHLLPEILARLGMNSDGGRAGSHPLRRLQKAVQHSLPKRWRPHLRRIVGLGPVKRIQAQAGALRFPLESPLTRAAALENNRVGAIRLNLRDREPFGRVEPGAEADAVLSELRTELLALTDPATGLPIVSRVLTAAQAFGTAHPDVPDLLVLFRSDIGLIERCRSARIGEIHVPIDRALHHRSGDHTVESRLWAAGPGIAAGLPLPEANVLDLTPTILRSLGVPLPENLDGRPIPLDKAP